MLDIIPIMIYSSSCWLVHLYSLVGIFLLRCLILHPPNAAKYHRCHCRLETRALRKIKKKHWRRSVKYILQMSVCDKTGLKPEIRHYQKFLSIQIFSRCPRPKGSLSLPPCGSLWLEVLVPENLIFAKFDSLRILCFANKIICPPEMMNFLTFTNFILDVYKLRFLSLNYNWKF